MVRAVLDTNIVVSACLRPGGAPATIVELALLGSFIVCLSPDVLREYREVLARPKFSRQLERIGVLLDGLEAEAAEADFLVTGNRRHFPELFGKTRVVAPREFLTELGF